MSESDGFVLARVLHVLGVVLWIGGVAFVTTVLIPSLRQFAQPGVRRDLFERLEGRFAWQARLTTLLTGVSGFYMLDFLHAWERYRQAQFWWLHLMTVVWLIFTLALFVIEPLFQHRRSQALAGNDDPGVFRRLQRLHAMLLGLSLLAVAAAVAGVHGGGH